MAPGEYSNAARFVGRPAMHHNGDCGERRNVRLLMLSYDDD